MPVRTKITLGLLTMLVLLLAIGGYSIYSVQQLDQRVGNTLHANFYSIELGQQMLRDLDELQAGGSARVVADFRRQLTREAGNITEPGERELVDTLTATFAAYQNQLAADSGRAAHAVAPHLLRLRGQTHRMIALNVAALTAGNSKTSQLFATNQKWLMMGVTVAVLFALMLVFSLPELVIAPLRNLQAGIRHATNRDFSQSIPVESHDEFGEVARDFNALLAQLNEFRASTAADLLTERNRLASVINTLDEGLLLVDQNRTILLANPVAINLLGLSGEKLVGRPASEVAAENDLLRAVLRPLDTPDRAAATAEAMPLLTIAQHGEEAYYRLSAHDIVSFNEARDKFEFVGYILALHNVSDFKKLDQVKSSFLATVAHELKTPLASIGLSLKILLDERVAADERQQVVLGMRQETQRLQRLVSELLDVSRLDSGNIALDFHPVPVAELVRYATDPVQQQLAQRELTIVTDLPADLPPVRADVEKASWVLLNLLVNAVRYSPVGERITIAARAEGGTVRISVQDQGPGIAPANHERIFQRFAQIPDKAGYKGGSGLGLSIAREFISAQNGRLWVESELGAGSTFHFTLPVVAG